MLDVYKPAIFICSNGKSFARSPWAIFRQGEQYYIYHYRTGYQFEIPPPHAKASNYTKLENAIGYALRNDPSFPRRQFKEELERLGRSGD